MQTHRLFIPLAFALLAACSSGDPGNAAAVPPATAVIVRDADARHVAMDDAASAILLTWRTEPDAAPVEVLASTRPEASLSDMERLSSGVTEGSLNVPANGRTYFAIRPSAGGEAVYVATRVVPLAGGRNFRDLGGYQTDSGQRVKWGTIYRSGVMSGFTAADQAYLDGLDVRTIVDFRSVEERTAEPTVWSADNPEYLSRDYSTTDQDSALRELFNTGEFSAETTRAAMTALYGDIARQQAASYAMMFDKLVSGDLPLVFNCSAGKDRTGMAAALLLTALGVPRETIVEDYALSDDVVNYAAAFELDGPQRDNVDESPFAYLRQLPREAVMPMFASDPAYIEAGLADIERQYGSVMAFIQNELDVSDADLVRLRGNLLTQ